MFWGLGVGSFLAFERDTGRLAWKYRPERQASFHDAAYFQVVNGRLHTGDMGILRIFEPAPEKTKAKAPKSRGRRKGS